ncbi:hypothetical protein EXN66_Car013309 [Channa argus]|uniref:Uncharacterized protein n=1 Tax=Channa argus TaxID=215402 RepID=A0A6G1Q5A9_CHAAH|nr:hypothetical protein EXN66_Car013309 [Channa argus]
MDGWKENREEEEKRLKEIHLSISKTKKLKSFPLQKCSCGGFFGVYLNRI